MVGHDGQRWAIRRGVVRGRDSRGWRWRWRGPDPAWLEALRIADLADLAEIPVVGVVALAIVVPVVVAVVVAFLPFLALGLLEALVLAVLATALLAAATLFGRPIIVRAARDGATNRLAMVVWAVTGWSASRRIRDQVTGALRVGADPIVAAGTEATLIADHRTTPDAGAPSTAG